MKLLVLGLAVASIFTASNLMAAIYADEVVDYQPGSGAASGYSQAASALGAPATAIVDPIWGDSLVTPFNAPYQLDQIVSVGAGGYLTVRFSQAIVNDPANPYGVDFIIHGNSMFMDSDWPNGKTDAYGTTFGENSGATEVWVSADGDHYYRLSPSLAPVVDGLYPTDGQGTPGVPVNPALTRGAFAGRNLGQIRGLYAGSAGGSSYDLAWAQDGSGSPVNLAAVNFVRVNVLAGVSEIDAFTAVPEPRTWALGSLGGGLVWLIRRRKG